MDPVPTFFVEESNYAQVTLRTYTWGELGPNLHDEWVCPGTGEERRGHRAARVVYDRAPVQRSEDRYLAVWPAEDFPDEQWPQACELCGAPAEDGWHRVVDQETIYVASDGREWPSRDLPVGAMYDGWWQRKGPDGIGLTVVIPPGRGAVDHWQVDARAGNCNRPDLDHYCWVRTGNPRLEPVTVGKGAEGTSCTAGAGSILSDAWHGYLRNGQLVE
jgi:hypothetical protein